MNHLRQELETTKSYASLQHSNHENGNSEISKSDSKFKIASSKPAPRLYCDICDMFDLHETEDCPVQGELSNEHETHSKYNYTSLNDNQTTTTTYKPVNNRAYCDVCEQFGHEEVNCSNTNNEKKITDEDEEY